MERKHVSPAGLALIKGFESFSCRQYLCPAGRPTIGYGHVVRASDNFPRTITQAQAEVLLQADLAPIEIYLSAVFPWLTQPQFDALASFCFNVGLGAFEGSRLFKCLKADDLAGAAEQFPRWIYSMGKVLPGLVRRRTEERTLFMTPEAS